LLVLHQIEDATLLRHAALDVGRDLLLFLDDSLELVEVRVRSRKVVQLVRF